MNEESSSDNKRNVGRYVLRGLQLFVDLAALSIAYWFAFLLRFESDLSFDACKLLMFTWPYVLVLKFTVLFGLRVPEISWRYIGMREAARVGVALAVATGVLVGLRVVGPVFGGYFKFVTIPFGVLGMDFGLSVLGVVGVRVLRRAIAERLLVAHGVADSLTVDNTLAASDRLRAWADR
ncbi:MAG: hypothetical protein QME96_16790, partial [Myxococcota bacterium]|nr:hypothetical protein [Myxococcota bacterium]